MKTKRHYREKLQENIQSLFNDKGATLANIKDTINSQVLLKEYWLKRANAIVIDYFILLIATGIMWPTAHLIEFTITVGILAILYFTITESIFGYTIGKKIFALRVTGRFGTKVSLKTSFKRNLSKFNPGFLILDVVIGHFTSKTHKKYLDKITNTTVERVITNEFTFSELTSVETTH